MERGVTLTDIYEEFQIVWLPTALQKSGRKRLGREVGLEPCKHNIGHPCITEMNIHYSVRKATANKLVGII